MGVGLEAGEAQLQSSLLGEPLALQEGNRGMGQRAGKVCDPD
jgi:hypothetical protein